jgi:hypothetical protein
LFCPSRKSAALFCTNVAGGGGNENAAVDPEWPRPAVPEGGLERGHAARLKHGEARLRPRQGPSIAPGMRRVKTIALLAVLIGGIAGPAAAQQSAVPEGKGIHSGGATPLRLLPARPPRVRPPQPAAIPEQYGPPQEAYAAFPEGSGSAPSRPSECQTRLEAIATFKPLPVLSGPGECGATDAVALDGVLLSDGTKAALSPPATLRCSMAEAIATWLREDVAPSVLKLGAPLRGVDNYDSYECRGRNRVRGATLSEHGRANALDIRGFKLANGETFGLTDVNAPKDWRETVRATACARFSTVLGPGSDGNHEQHIHVDLAERRHNEFKMCEWDIREPAKQAEKPAPAGESNTAKPEEEAVPLPRPRPVATADDAQARAKKTRSQFR